jgi:hypothetical protein
MQHQMNEGWPALPLDEWSDTYATLHMYTQIVGKVRMALTPTMNEWWNVALYVTSRGLTTSPIPYGNRTFQMDFDFHDHLLLMLTSTGDVRRIPLGSSVRGFYREVMSTLRALDIDVAIRPVPVEVPNPIPFEEDTLHAVYDPGAARRFWEVLTRVDMLFKQFRARFTGKCSPVHFFWGSFDLAVSRFSGRPTPVDPNTDPITRLAYDQEVSSLGFWPGGTAANGVAVDGACFYAYMVPRPTGLESARISPPAAFFHEALGEHMLMYDDVRASAEPERAVLDFARSTYDAGAQRARWPDFTASWGEPPSPSVRRQEAGASTEMPGVT